MKLSKTLSALLLVAALFTSGHAKADFLPSSNFKSFPGGKLVSPGSLFVWVNCVVTYPPGIASGPISGWLCNEGLAAANIPPGPRTKSQDDQIAMAKALNQNLVFGATDPVTHGVRAGEIGSDGQFHTVGWLPPVGPIVYYQGEASTVPVPMAPSTLPPQPR